MNILQNLEEEKITVQKVFLKMKNGTYASNNFKIKFKLQSQSQSFNIFIESTLKKNPSLLNKLNKKNVSDNAKYII